MTYVTGVVAVFVFVYLITAMIRPEWFWRSTITTRIGHFLCGFSLSQ